MIDLDHLPWCIEPAPQGGVRLVAARAFAAGETVVQERPRVFVEALPIPDAGPDPATLLAHKLLSHPGLQSEYRTAEMTTNPRFRAFADETVVQQLARETRTPVTVALEVLMSVMTNCCACLVGVDRFVPVGYGVYTLIACADHSCRPNCALVPAESGPPNAALAAARDISAGDAITWNYLQAHRGFLDLRVHERSLLLVEHMRFFCRCERCVEERPDIGESDLFSYYDDLLLFRRPSRRRMRQR